MQNQTYLLADIPVNIEFQYNFLKESCYGFESKLKPLFSFCVTRQLLESEQEEFRDITTDEAKIEFLTFHRLFCDAAIFHDVLLFHASAVMVEGRAYLFAGPSGIGKSTHAALWKKILGDRVIMINDDKPLVRQVNGNFVIFGSPWNGREHLGNNVSAPLAGICFLNQGKTNIIRTLSNHAKLPLLIPQTYCPENEKATQNMLRLLLEMSEQIPMWRLDCTISREAAELSYNTMRSTTK